MKKPSITANEAKSIACNKSAGAECSFVRLAVSKKAYKGFIDRIKSVYASDAAGERAMTEALNRYLAGDKGAANGLDSAEKLAFAFLCQDVDQAMERSRRARARRRKTAVTEREMPSVIAAKEVEKQPHGGNECAMELPEKLRKLADDCLSGELDGVPKAEIGRRVKDALANCVPLMTPPMTRRERRAQERAERRNKRKRSIWDSATQL